MSFTLLPAVDVADGQSVRLVQGEAGTSTTHGDPREAALRWQADGAAWIHLVDLDAAFGRGSNAALLADVIRGLDVRVELAGGIRDDASLQRALSTGCERVVLGTAAVVELDWCARVLAAHGARVAAGLDVRVVTGADGAVQYRLAARGGAGDSGDLWETIARLDREGCARYVVTDVSRDGMLAGPNMELYRAITSVTDAAVIASGGVSTIDDVVAMVALSRTAANLEGAIIGKALYAGRFTLQQALAASLPETGGVSRGTSLSAD